MIEYSKQISKRWALPQDVADHLCASYGKGDSPFYLAEYDLLISAYMDISSLWDVFAYLDSMEELAAKRKRVANAYKKAGKLTDALEKRINRVTDTHVLDDILIPLRPNPKSKGQLAAKKGIGDLADLIAAQTEEAASVEELAEAYVGKDPALKTTDDVLQEVKYLLAERFAHDDTVRAMAREFLREDGFYEVIPRNRKDDKYNKYAGRFIPIGELSNEELLRLSIAEDKKEIILKLNVQMFKIDELLRQHIISNPDSTAFDCLCEIIGDIWPRLLHPSIEPDVKEQFRLAAEEWASKEIAFGLTSALAEEQARSSVFVVDMSAKKDFTIVAVSGGGTFLGATAEKKPGDGRSYLTERLRQFFNRHRPGRILAPDGGAPIPDNFLKQAGDYLGADLEVTRVKPAVGSADPCKSDYMKQREFAVLDARMTSLYGLAITHLQPVTLVSRLGPNYYKVHPLQSLLPEEKFAALVGRVLEYAQLLKGISVKDIADSPIAKFKCVTAEILAAIKTHDTAKTIGAKNDLLQVSGMTETVFRNIAGFVLIPNAESPIDRSTVHPDQITFLEEVSDEFTISPETLVANPEILHSVPADDANFRAYLQRKLAGQLKTAQRYQSMTPPKSKKKHRLSDVKEGAVLSGRVTNITQFGVFVNINAVCDGLIHISQLADEYVETPNQIVSVGDRVDVRVLKVDTKKRRISLSMKNTGLALGMVAASKPTAPKGAPSKGQLSNLAEHFKNR